MIYYYFAGMYKLIISAFTVAILTVPAVTCDHNSVHVTHSLVNAGWLCIEWNSP